MKRLTNEQIDKALQAAPFPEEFGDVSYALPLIKALGWHTPPNDSCWKDLARLYGQRNMERVIERATTGDPAWAAYFMALSYGSEREWAESVIERATIGDPAWAAYCMAWDCGSEREWAEKVIERATIGDPARAAYCMARVCGSDREWARRIETRR